MDQASAPRNEETAEAQQRAARTLHPNTRSEEAGGSLTNTSEEVAQHLRRMLHRPPAATPPAEKK